jgi:hypothetical protein
MPSKEEAERMADAILAAHRQSSKSSRARGPAESPGVHTGSAPARWPALVATGGLTGAIAAVLPSHSALVGLLVGLLIAGCVGVIAQRLRR